MDIPLDEVIYFDCITTHPTTGAATDADSTPTFAVYEEATDTDIGVGGNLTKRTSLTGNYRGSFTASAANGFEVGKWYSVIGSATVNSIAGKAVLRGFRIVAAESVAGKPKVDVDAFGGSAGTFSSGRPEVNTSHLAGTAYASADFSATMKASINTEADTALTDYGALKPTIAGRTLDVTAGGTGGIDWGNVESPTTTVGLTGTTTAWNPAWDAEVQSEVEDGIGAFNWSTVTIGTVTTLTNLPAITANWLTAAGIADGAFTAAKFAASSLDGKGNWNVGKTGYSLTATTGLGNQTADITGSLSGSVGSVTGAVGSVTGAVGSVTGNVGGNVTGSVGSLATQAKADVNAEVVDVLDIDTSAEVTSPPAATSSIRARIAWLFKLARNKRAQTSTTETVYADDTTTANATSTKSDDGTTFTRGEWT